MRKNKGYLLLGLLSLCTLTAGLVSCGETSSATSDKISTTTIETSVENIQIVVGQTTSFNFQVLPTSSSQTITLDFDKTIIDAKVKNDSINVQALKVGQTDLVLKTIDGASKTIKVTVVSSQNEKESIEFTEEEITLVEGESKTISYQLKPETSKYTDLTLDYDQNILDVKITADNFTVTGLMPGTTNLKITTKNGAFDTLKVTVQEAPDEILPTAISTNFIRKVIGVNEELPIEVTFTPSNATNKELRYLSNNPSVAIVNNGVLKGVARGEAIITISSVANPNIASITLSLTVSDDEDKVNQDKIDSYVSISITNESEDITGGTITIESKNRNSSNPDSFKNTYQAYNGAIYNHITDYDGLTYTDYYARYEDNVYHISKADEILNQEQFVISDSSFFTNEISEEEAKELTSLPAYLPYSYSSNYSYGVGSYVENELLNLVFFNAATEGTQIIAEDDQITLSLVDESYDYTEIYSLELIFENNNFKEVHYERNEYLEDCFDEDGNLIEGSIPRAYDHFDAELTNGTKIIDENPEIDPEGFFYSDFEVKFFLTSDDTETGKTTFNVADNIIFKLDSFSPNTANAMFDRIEIAEVSNPNVIEIGMNKTSMIAVGEGVCDVTLKSKNVTKTYTLTVNTPVIESISFSSGLTDSLASNEQVTFQVERYPAGSIDDIVVELSEGAEKYATLGMTSYGYYYLQGNKDMTEKSAIIKVIAYSESRPEVRIEKEVTIIRVLTDQEIHDILVSQTFKSDINTEYYNYFATIQFNEDRSGTFIVYMNETKVYETCKFRWAISNGAIAITEEVYTSDLFTDLSVSLTEADLSSFTVSVVDNYEYGDEYGYTYDFIMRRNNNA